MKNKILGVSNAIIKNNHILLIKREHDPLKGLLCFPGGKVEEEEEYLKATSRETFEETGLTVSFPKFHLLSVTYIKNYMILTSLSEYKMDINISFIHNGISCQWYDKADVLELEDNLFVPNLKLRIEDAFELIKLNKLI
jgi:8-oxo-dGTP pyrophosphatase MutT (NUDIX family)